MLYKHLYQKKKKKKQAADTHWGLVPSLPTMLFISLIYPSCLSTYFAFHTFSFCPSMQTNALSHKQSWIELYVSFLIIYLPLSLVSVGIFWVSHCLFAFADIYIRTDSVAQVLKIVVVVVVWFYQYHWIHSILDTYTCIISVVPVLHSCDSWCCPQNLIRISQA